MCFSESNDELLVPGANRLNRHFVPNSGQKRAGTEVMLAEVFPAAFYFVYNMIGVVLALLMIGFQIALICVQGPVITLTFLYSPTVFNHNLFEALFYR